MLFVGLAVWLGRGAPRPVFRTAWIAILATAVVALLPLKKLIADNALGDSFVALALWRELQPSRYSVAVLASSGVAVALWALLPRKLLVVLPAALVAAFAAGSLISSREAIAQARLQQQRLVGPDPRWIDRAADGPVTFLYDGDPYWTTVWENLFFNRRLTKVVDLPGTNVPGPLPQSTATPAGDGTMTGLPRYVVAWDTFTFDGTEVTRAPLLGVTHSALVLWRLRTPRLESVQTGLTPNGELVGGATATLRVYGCLPGEARVTMFGKELETVTLTLNRGDVQTFNLKKGQIFSGTIPTPAHVDGRGFCEFGIRTTGLLGVTQLEFDRS